jgi:sugar lactone lactonase YvrE
MFLGSDSNPDRLLNTGHNIGHLLLATPGKPKDYPVPPHRRHQVHRQVAGLLFLLTLVSGCSAGCSSKTFQTTPPMIEPAQPAQSPPLSQSPEGVVWPLDGRPQAVIFDTRTLQLAMLVCRAGSPAPAAVAVLSARKTLPRVIDLPGPATALTGDGGGTAYLSTRGGYFAVDLATGQVSRVAIAHGENIDFAAIARRADGMVMLGTADGTLYAVAAGRPADDASRPGPPAGHAKHPAATAVANRTKVFAHIDSLAVQGNTVAVLDRAQTSVTTIGADGKVGQELRAGQGATTMAADPAGRLLVADTRGGQLLVFGVDPLILRQAYPVPQSPYGLAGSRGLAWVSQTAANTVIGYDLSTGIPVEKVRYPTVQQPNSLAFDDASGTLYVVSGSGQGVQVIEHAAGPG